MKVGSRAMFLVWWSGALAAGCYGQDRFASDFAEANCLLYSDCEVLDDFGFDGIEQCEATTSESYTKESGGCDSYDREAARDCVDGVNQMICEDIPGNTYPEACLTACSSAEQ